MSLWSSDSVQRQSLWSRVRLGPEKVFVELRLAPEEVLVELRLSPEKVLWFRSVHFFLVCCRRAWSLCRVAEGFEPAPMEKEGVAGEPKDGALKLGAGVPGLPKGMGAGVEV